MARNVKPGITFYRMDSGHITNKKVRLLCNEFDSDGYYIWSCLIDYAYGNYGYYFDINDKEELELFASEYCKKKLTLVQEVIRGCISRGLFDKTVADSFGVLTSCMMQEAFLFATSDRRAKGSTFEIQENWLLIDIKDQIPLNIKIVPGKNKINPPKKPQTRQYLDNTKQKPLATHENFSSGHGKINGSEGQDARRKKFIAPDIAAVKSFFLQQYNPANPGTWFPDRCNREAMDFFDYYSSNGWKQGRASKPIVDWEAAARRWIRTAKDGTYSNAIGTANGQPVVQKPAAPVSERSNINPTSKDINYLYEKYLEDPLSVTYQGVDSVSYDHLKSKGMITFTDDKIEEIKQSAIETIAKVKIDPTDKILAAYMKKIAVIEFFKQSKQQGLEVIFS